MAELPAAPVVRLVCVVQLDEASPVTIDLAGNRLNVSLDGTLFVSYGYDDASRLTDHPQAEGGG